MRWRRDGRWESEVESERMATGQRVIAIDAEHGFHVEKYVDLYHKRSALAMIGREKFFGLCPLHWGAEMGLDAVKVKTEGKEVAKL